MQIELNPRLRLMVACFVSLFFVVGCSSTSQEPVQQQEPVEEPSAPVKPKAKAPVDFAPGGLDPIDSRGRPISRTFYFEYDKAVLSAADLAALELHAKILKRNSDRSLVIEGHCDERGTREYNLALGEQRANAVSSFLRSSGVSSRQLETVSYGEEQPSDPGHNESAWSKNRRAVLSYR